MGNGLSYRSNRTGKDKNDRARLSGLCFILRLPSSLFRHLSYLRSSAFICGSISLEKVSIGGSKTLSRSYQPAVPEARGGWIAHGADPRDRGTSGEGMAGGGDGGARRLAAAVQQRGDAPGEFRVAECGGASPLTGREARGRRSILRPLGRSPQLPALPRGQA